MTIGALITGLSVTGGAAVYLQINLLIFGWRSLAAAFAQD